ncbi:hypothetical protein IMZ17_16895 [Geobacillus stearothermophilus]|jgi:hypothetical protein|uniref:Uncharacterized protein n=1 Tax=Geobacillus stearothermophilus TaxID=1422 RepID=A0A150N8C4_GEOSE|nr:hypothetical protein B4114_3119 [Geobacillus stearothermophilus]QOR86030.1 hypothetical protein IMZ17_16895 [Geobacillus stearothermophilus]
MTSSTDDLDRIVFLKAQQSHFSILPVANGKPQSRSKRNKHSLLSLPPRMMFLMPETTKRIGLTVAEVADLAKEMDK